MRDILDLGTARDHEGVFQFSLGTETPIRKDAFAFAQHVSTGSRWYVVKRGGVASAATYEIPAYALGRGVLGGGAAMSSETQPSVTKMVKSLSQDELREMAEEIFVAARQALANKTERSFFALDRVLKDWQYTALIRLNPAFEGQLVKIEEEIDKDPAPGTEWRKLLGR